MAQKRPSVGLACIVYRNGQILLSNRTKAPQKNSWQCPGGFMYVNETPSTGMQRILKRETGLCVDLQATAFYTNNIFKIEKEHSVTLYFRAICATEKTPIGPWQWFDFQALPEPLFLPLDLLLKNYQNAVKHMIYDVPATEK